MASWSQPLPDLTSARALIVPTASGRYSDIPAKILAAGEQLSGFEPQLELNVDDCRVGHIPALTDEPPYAMCEATILACLERQQWPVLLPSSMATTWGAVRAVWKHLVVAKPALQSDAPPLTVLSIGAHADVLPVAALPNQLVDLPVASGWLEQPFRHQFPVVHIGMRSCTAAAWQWARSRSPAFELVDADRHSDGISGAISNLPKQPVFLALDCSILDPSLVPDVPNPEPGGWGWQELVDILQLLFAERTVVGVALGGLGTNAQGTLSLRVVARLLNRILACHFVRERSASPCS